VVGLRGIRGDTRMVPRFLGFSTVQELGGHAGCRNTEYRKRIVGVEHTVIEAVGTRLRVASRWGGIGTSDPVRGAAAGSGRRRCPGYDQGGGRTPVAGTGLGDGDRRA